MQECTEQQIRVERIWARKARPEGERVAYEKCDISESDELFARYGLTIPVLASPDGRELCWPFTASQLQQFLRS